MVKVESPVDHDQQILFEYDDIDTDEEEESGEERLPVPVLLDVIAGSEGGVWREMCAICWNVFAAGTGVMKLPCDHLFHEECIEAWFARKLNCSMCPRNCVGLRRLT